MLGQEHQFWKEANTFYINYMIQIDKLCGFQFGWDLKKGSHCTIIGVFFQVRSSSVKAYSTIEQKCGNIVGYIKRKYNDQHLKNRIKTLFRGDCKCFAKIIGWEFKK